MRKVFLICCVLTFFFCTQVSASLITMDAIGSGDYFSATDMKFKNKREKASYESDFGLFSMIDPTDTYQLFSYDQEPGAVAFVNSSNWAPLEEGFGFYFDVHTGGKKDATAEYNWFSDSSFNQLSDGTAQDVNVNHVLTNLINRHFMAVLLDDQLGGGDRDFNDMQIGGYALGNTSIESVTVAPVPEPATLLLVGTGLMGVVGSRLRRKQ